jgi:outer membrane receptor for ferrienterochelin and colicins
VENYESYYRSWDEFDVYFDADQPYHVASVFAQNEHQLNPNLALTMGLRGDRYPTVGWTASPRAALVYHPRTASTIKLLYGESFRAPGMYETHYDDGQTIGNPDLKPEKIRTSELVWEQ